MNTSQPYQNGTQPTLFYMGPTRKDKLRFELEKAPKSKLAMSKDIVGWYDVIAKYLHFPIDKKSQIGLIKTCYDEPKVWIAKGVQVPIDENTPDRIVRAVAKRVYDTAMEQMSGIITFTDERMLSQLSKLRRGEITIRSIAFPLPSLDDRVLSALKHELSRKAGNNGNGKHHSPRYETPPLFFLDNGLLSRDFEYGLHA